MTSPFAAEVHSKLQYQIRDISAILASGSQHKAEDLFAYCQALDQEARLDFVAALIGELLVARARSGLR